MATKWHNAPHHTHSQTTNPHPHARLTLGSHNGIPRHDASLLGRVAWWSLNRLLPANAGSGLGLSCRASLPAVLLGMLRDCICPTFGPGRPGASGPANGIFLRVVWLLLLLGVQLC